MYMTSKLDSSLTANDNNQSLELSNGDPNEFLPSVVHEDIREVETAFRDLIEEACSNDSDSSRSIFEHTYVPRDSFGFLFRSIIPSSETIQHEFESDLTQNLFKYEENGCVKYAFQVLDRRTNRLTCEQMPSYHRYGMRLLFSGPVQRELLLTNAIKKLFAHETMRLGRAFDEPRSRRHIPTFIRMYQIDLNELLEPDISTYSTFNEFFYRKLKPEARPIDSLDDPDTIVSAADCRLVVFDHINQATLVWIKGNQFCLRSLFDDENLAQEFDGGSIAVFRLAPDDYHRFHSPIRGTVGDYEKTIPGTYYTVNPIAITGQLDVLTSNQRKVITIENDVFDKVAFVAIGALLVGSVNFTVRPNQTVEKGDELGYFAYGGSTIVVVFKLGMVKWDEDLQHNSRNSMETLVRMGEHIGQRVTESERLENIAKLSKYNDKYTALDQLLRYVPSADCLKES